MEASDQRHYLYTVNIQTPDRHAHRDNYLDLIDLSRCIRPAAFAYDFRLEGNDIKMTQFVTGKAFEIAQAMAANR